jgi:DNA integrity scanning protein DisA with diadenylate cyclase activity
VPGFVSPGTAGWRVYPGLRLADQLSAQLARICTDKRKALSKDLARHLTTIALTLREDRLGALLVVSPSEHTVSRLTRSRRGKVSPAEALYSRLFVSKPLCKISPQLVCNAAALDGAIVIDSNGIVRGIGCIFSTGRARTEAEGARTRAALFASKNGGVALKISQDGEVSIFSNGIQQETFFSPVW